MSVRMNNENVSLLRSTDPNSKMSKTFFYFMFLRLTFVKLAQLIFENILKNRNKSMIKKGY